MAPRGNLAVVALTIWSIVVGFAAGNNNVESLNYNFHTRTKEVIKKNNVALTG